MVKMPKLSIELVPASAWYTNVRSNVPKAEWDRLRKAVYLAANYRCEICNGVGDRWPVECHEVWLYDDKAHTQTLERLIALCPACHEVKHIGRAGVMGRQAEALEHLAAVNEWTLSEARSYAAECFRVWEERSKHDWALDTSALENYSGDNKAW